MRILWDNEADKFTPAASTEESGYPATNAQHIHLARAWRTTGVDGEYLTLDAGAGNTITATCAAIIGKSPYTHNLTNAATIKIQAHPTDAWGAPDLDQAFTWSAGTMLVFFTSTAKRFWRFYFDDDANPDGYLEIPRLFLGTYLQMPYIEPGAELPLESNAEVMTSLSGQVYGDLRIQRLAPTFRLPIVGNTERLAINAMFAEVDITTPVLLAVWEDSLDVEPPLYCRIDQERLEYAKAAEPGVLWSLDLAFQEVY